MTSGLRPFTLSALRACTELRRFLTQNSDLTVDEAITLMCRVSESWTALDFQTGRWLHTNLPIDVSPSTSELGLRTLLTFLIDVISPTWAAAVPYGRDRVISILNTDEQQLFREAGLLNPVPSREIIDWWDNLAARVRGQNLSQLVAQGREAERLSFESEAARLKLASIPNAPVWVALDDNRLGYDILSFDRLDGSVVPKQIEVKGETRGLIYLTKNEWENALSSSHHEFHIWSLNTRECFVLRAPDLIMHIPVNKGQGEWESVCISVAGIFNPPL